MRFFGFWFLLLLPPISGRGHPTSKHQRKSRSLNPIKIRQDIQQFQDSGQYVDMVQYLEEIIERQGHLVIDDQLPSLYNFYGVALHTLQKVDLAEQAFMKCVEYNPKDSRY